MRENSFDVEGLERRLQLDSTVVFNEIMYNPGGQGETLEYIELHNQMAVDMDLSKWQLEGGVNFTFAEGTIIPGRGYLVIAANPTALQSATGLTGIRGPYIGALNNNGETIRLVDRNERRLDEISYGDSGAWPVAADGSGASLTKINQDTTSGPARHWRASPQIGGTPGRINFATGTEPSRVIDLFGLDTAWRYDASNVAPDSSWKTTDYNDSSWSSGQGLFFAGTGQVDGTSAQVITGVKATPSSEVAGIDRKALYIVNGAGLSATNTHSNAPNGTMWLNQGNFGGAPPDTNPEITFDLGGLHYVNQMRVWNYNEQLPGRTDLLTRGIKTADVLVAGEDGVFRLHIANQNFNIAPGTTNVDFSQIIDLGGVAVRYVKLDNLVNHGNVTNFMGLSEVQFTGTREQRRTQVPLGASTYYFRKEFSFSDSAARTDLLLNMVVDDGAVLYLNGTELHRRNIPDGVPSHTTLARDEVINGAFTGEFVLPGSLLRSGKNVLAVEVHGRGSGDPDMLFGAEMEAVVRPPNPNEFKIDVAFNEVSAADDSQFFVELVNHGATGLNVGNFIIRSSTGGEYRIGAGVINPGQYFTVTEQQLGFPLFEGDRLFLLNSSGDVLIDGVQVDDDLRGRSPAGTGEWLFPQSRTPGSANSFDFHDEIVINEIMYNHRPTFPTQDVPATFEINTLLPVANNWKFNRTGANLGANWHQTIYPVDGTTWHSGPGLIGVESTALAEPIRTTWTGYSAAVRTYYFQTEFTFNGLESGTELLMRHLIDDGAIFYLNGQELRDINGGTTRFGLAETGVDFQTLATGVDNATWSPYIALPASALNIGTNILSVEVHQGAANSTDIVFGMELVSRKALTPFIPGTPFMDSDEEWIELYNRSSQTINIGGWRLDDAVEYRFPAGTMMAPGEYIVVARDADALRQKYPGIRVFGDFDGTLDNVSDRVVLLDDDRNPADVVQYYNDGRWADSPDGGGTSLELRDPGADNTIAENWAASNELGRTDWLTYTYRGTTAASAAGVDGPWNEFVMGLLDAGEILIDDIKVIENPRTTAAQLIQNSTFSAGNADKWRLLGNHSHSQVVADPDDPGNFVLKLVATGETEHMSNHAETTLKNGNTFVTIANNREYEISFRARWLSGSPQLLTRLYYNRLPRTTYLEQPELSGTPGAQNSSFTSNIGPTYTGFQHSPAVPAPLEPVTVTVNAADPEGVQSMTLRYSVAGAAFVPVSMTHMGGGRYQAQIPGQNAGTIVQFYVEGVDSQGAASTFPAEGVNSRALFQVNDNKAATNGLHNLRIIMTAPDANLMHANFNLMSNDRIPGTVIYNEREIFYNVGIRLKGSEHSRVSTARVGFNVDFPSDQLFRGVHSTVALDRSESTGYGQREILIHAATNHAGGLPTKYNDLVQIITPQAAHTGAAELQLARFSDVFLDEQFENGGDGEVFEYELQYRTTSNSQAGNVESFKVFTDADGASGVPIRNMGDDKENYRWTQLLKNNSSEDDFSKIIAFSKIMGLTGAAFTSQIASVIDVDQWLRGFALATLTGVADSYSATGDQHNVQFYVRPSDGKVLHFPHDLDAFFATDRSIASSPELNKMLTVPAWARAYYGHINDIINTSYNTTYLARWAANYGALLPAQPFASHLAFVGQRVANVNTQLASRAPQAAFVITTNGGNNLDVTTPTVAIAGNAWINVREIYIQGRPNPLELTWTDQDSWTANIPLVEGANALVFEARDFQGNVIATDSITVTSTTPAPSVINDLRITEIMYNPSDPTAAEIAAGFADDDQFEFIELLNAGAAPINLNGTRLSDGVTFQFGNTTLNPGQRVLVVRNSAAMTARYGAGLNIAGQWLLGDELNDDGEPVRLEDIFGAPVHQFTYSNAGTWPTRANGNGSSLEVVSTSGDYNHPDNWRSSTEFGGSPGAAGAGPINSIVINEVLTNTLLPDTDAIELFNPTGQSIDISGWFLSDSNGNYAKFEIPAGTVLDPGEYIVFTEEQFNPTPQTPGPDDFSLDGAEGDDVFLTQADANGKLLAFIDDVHFGAAAEGRSMGRAPNAVGRLVPLVSRTLGGPNSAPSAGAVVISEVMYNGGDQPDLEFVELFNNSNATVDLSRWRIDQGVTFTFPQGTALAPFGTIVVLSFNPETPENSGRAAAFRAAYGIDQSVRLVGNYGGLLDGGQDTLRLLRPDAPPPNDPTLTPYLLEDEVDYTSSAPWPTTPDGTGDSLSRLSETSYGNDPASWTGRDPTPGRHFDVFNFTGSPDAEVYTLTRIGNELVLLLGETPQRQELLRRPISAVTELNINAGSGANQLIIDLNSGNSIPAGGVRFQGGTGVDVLTIDGAGPTPLGGLITFNGDEGNNQIITDGGSVRIAADTTGNGVLSLQGSGSSHVELAESHFFGSVALGDTASVKLASGKNVLRTNSLVMSSGAKIDLTDGAMVIHGGSLDQVRGRIGAGRGSLGGVASGKWNGVAGITSSTAAAEATINERFSVGYARNGDLLQKFSSFFGVNVGDDDILIRYTRNADASLDGVVNNNDITLLAGFYRPGTPGRHWHQGNFNYDEETNNNDITILAGNYRPSDPPVGAEDVAAASAPDAVASGVSFNKGASIQSFFDDSSDVLG